VSAILPELQEIIFASRTALSERLMGVEDELGTALADLGSGEGIPGGWLREHM
jgi:16S rRNA G527 N7-methylase RsmG